MPRVNIFLTNGPFKWLRYYLSKTYGRHKALSLTVQQALEEYLGSRLTCEQCGKPFKEARGRDSLVIHHIIPLKDGGTDDLENLMVLCRSCHNKIHDIADMMRKAKANQYKTGV